MISTKGQDQVSARVCRAPGLREKMEAALDRMEELTVAVTRLQEKLEYVRLMPDEGDPCDRNNPLPGQYSDGNSAAEAVVAELSDRLQSLTVAVECMTQQVRV